MADPWWTVPLAGAVSLALEIARRKFIRRRRRRRKPTTPRKGI